MTYFLFCVNSASLATSFKKSLGMCAKRLGFCFLHFLMRWLNEIVKSATIVFELSRVDCNTLKQTYKRTLYKLFLTKAPIILNGF